MVIAKVEGKDVELGQFSFNKSILYAIKTITGDKENEILSYFYDIGIQLFQDAISRKRLPQRCDRKVKIFYKNSNFQVRFEVISNYFKSTYNDKVILSMYASCPQDNICIDGKDFSQAISEAGLGLSDQQVAIAYKPEEKLYRCLTKK
jgi:hypothetical protein